MFNIKKLLKSVKNKYFKKNKKKTVVKKRIFVIFFTLLTILIVLFAFYCLYNFFNTPKKLTNKNKQDIVSYSFLYLDSYLDSSIKRPDAPKLPKFEYEKLRIGLYKNGELVNQKTGTRDKNTKERLSQDLKTALYKIVKDEDFEKLKTDDLKGTRVIIEFIYKGEKISNDLKTAEQTIELGIDSFGMKTQDQNYYSYASDHIIHRRSLKKIFENLCSSAKLEKDCQKDKDITMSKYQSQTFSGAKDGSVENLYRFNNLLTLDDITQEKIKNSLSKTIEWYKNNTNIDSRLMEYWYYPSKDKYADDNNHVRQLASAWAMSELEQFINNSVPDQLTKSYLDYYLKFKKTRDNYAYMSIDNDSKLAYSAFTIQILLHSNYENKDNLIKEFADGIVAMQKENGSYQTDFEKDEDKGVDYYPGEAMLALMEVNKVKKNQTYIDSVSRAFPYYRDYWRSNQNLAFIPWQIQSYYALYQETKNQELAEFIFEMSNWTIDNYQIKKGPYPDKVGGFPLKNPSSSTSVYLEGLNDSYSLAVQIGNSQLKEKYKKTIRIGTRYIMQTQYNEENTFWVKNPKKVIGGFRNNVEKNDIRDDMTQHATLALIKAYQNKVFE